MVRLNQAPLSMSSSPVQKEVIAEASKAHAVTEDLCVTCIGIHVSAQKQPKVESLSLLCSSEI